ncbi:Protein FAR1-RELATED SEQUENCE [Abeliophyllum distichum]|uniref:Protein FAR1-RELATED SEQUENCE n=1 Tax=Abeliophyllum distichum TaxID=126358 RepID=A0ABD1TJG5_9LAMI
MSSSQRSESGHSFLKKYVDRKNSLTDFVTRFNRALVHQRHKELAANHIDLTQTPKNELVQSNSYICSKRSSSDEAKVYAVQRFEPGKTSDRTRQVKDIDTRGDVNMSKNRNRSLEETQVVYDPNPVRAKGCRKCLKLDNINQPQYSQDSSDQQYHTPDPQYAYHAPDPQYAYHTPDPQLAYHAPDPQYAYYAPDPQYAYHASDPQYSITCSNNASYSLDPREYDARFNHRH